MGPVTDDSSLFTKRNLGIIASAYAVSMIIQNAVFAASGAPGYGDPVGTVFTYHAEHRGALSVTSGMEVLNMVLVLFFVIIMHGLVKRRCGGGADWLMHEVVGWVAV